jgi:hypothetical protein
MGVAFALPATPPRRLAVRPIEEADLPLVRPELVGLLEVKVDGLVLAHCIAADADAGFAIFYRADRRGRMRLVLGKPLLAWKHGRVEIGWKS